jgi:hypothetical protein
VPSLTPGTWFIPVSNTALQASLSSAFLSLRQIVISSTLGMNALQSLSTSGVHARRCSSVPCEKQGTGKTVADSKPTTTHHFAKRIGRIQLFWSSMFIIGIASTIEADSRHLHHDRREYTLAETCACREMLSFGPFDLSTVLLLPLLKFGLLRCQYGGAQTTKSSHVRPSVGNDTSVNVTARK